MDDSGPRGVRRRAPCRTVPRDELVVIAARVTSASRWVNPQVNGMVAVSRSRCTPWVAIPAASERHRKSGTTNRVDVVRNMVGDTQCQPEATVRHE